MNSRPCDNPPTDQDRPLLASFLNELNMTRRKLSLYPANHPQIRSSVGKTLDILRELFRTDPVIRLGIAPDALYFEQLWLDRSDKAILEFAGFFSSLGIASISFHSGLDGEELIRFNQLLRADRTTIESFGGFEELLNQQQISHITVIPIDYDAFQAREDLAGQPIENSRLWESFLEGLHNGRLDFGDSDSALDLFTVAEIFNRKLVGNHDERRLYSDAIARFVENSVDRPPGPRKRTRTDHKLNELLGELTPEAQQEFLATALRVLDRHQDAAQDLLQSISPRLLQQAIADKSQQKLKVSTRLFGLISNLAGSNGVPQHNMKSGTPPLPEDMVRARLDVLFSEERQDLYMPGSYQSALQQIMSEDISGSIPDDEKQKLKTQIEEQSVERQYAYVIFELLGGKLDIDQEKAVQQNLLELSRFFLDTGDFNSLREIYAHWSGYLYSNRTSTNIFDEKVLASHTQLTFMAEVLDGFDLWEEARHQDLIDYITAVGEPYSEAVIERLGLAPTFPERRRWMNVLEKIGGDAQQKIIRALHDERWYLVRNLLSILGRELNQHSIRAVHQLSQHPHPLVRLEAVRVLLGCNPATANRQLRAELQSEDPEAQMAAVEIADLSRDPDVLALLHKNLETDIASDFELDLKKKIVTTLIRIGNKDSLPILRRLLQRQGLLLSKRIKLLQAEIIQQLGKFPGTSADKLLQELTEGKYRQLARQALQQRQENRR